MLIELTEVTSTNDYVKSHRGELSDGDAVTALRQTEGRGRRGHTWLCADGMLPLSILIKNPKNPSTLTLCAAVAVCSVLEDFYGSRYDFMIKWPNDILLNGYKLCGILCESVFFGAQCDIICGIGINLTQTAEYFQQASLPYGASLLMLTDSAPDRHWLVDRLAEQIYSLSCVDFGDVYNEYKRRCITLGRQVKLVDINGERIAQAVDIASNGNLVCRDNGGDFIVNSGEVSARGIYGYI